MSSFELANSSRRTAATGPDADMAEAAEQTRDAVREEE